MRKLQTVFIIFFLLASANINSAQETIEKATSVTIEKILSAPFPQEIIAAPSGGLVAWVSNARGARNIWVGAAPDYRGRQITNFTKDDGQELSNLVWTPDGKTIIYVRGGAANRQGEVPNPTSDPAGAEQSVWRIAASGADPVRIGQGNSPRVSPRGDGLAFVSRGQIFWAPLDASKEPSQLVRARGSAGSLRFSPDGARLAFVSNRGTHSFIAVYDMAAKSLKFVAPTIDSDESPVWSPSGNHLAFIRAPASTRINIFQAARRAQPWSIMLADLASNQTRPIFRAEEGSGSAFWPVVAESQLFWGAGDVLVFPWERDGWLHLYSVSVKGGEARLLTPGAGEVEYVTITPDRTQIIFNSNQGDINRRHLWRVPVGGGRAVALTEGKGIEWAPTVTSDGRAIAFLRSDARKPAHPAILMGGQARELAPGHIPAEFPEQWMVEPESVLFAAADGMQIHGQLFLPTERRPGERRPAIIFIHGGSRRQMLLGWHYGSYYHNAYGMNQYLASRGYVVLSVNFRSGTGYGMEFREALNYGAGGASEFNDILGAGLYLRGRDDIDPARIGLWGGSYGGYLTAMGLARASDLFAAGVDIHGVHDWNVGIRTFIPNYNPAPEVQRLAFNSSPMAYVDRWRSPVLVIHGDDDRNVSFIETVALVEALRERKVDVEQLVLPDEVHNFLTHANWLEVYRAAAGFFDRRLKK
jgi:dipeptidyl aminopeptidase/acylaminoacyl peptidase